MPKLRSGRRLLLVLAAAGVALVGFAAPASAHDRLVSSDPADGATVVVLPAAVTLEFSDEVMSTGTQVVVTKDGEDVGAAPAQVAGATVTAALPPDLANGDYAVAWRAVSADGHPIEGSFGFAVAVPEPTPSPDPTTASPSPAGDEPSDPPTDSASAVPVGADAATLEPSPVPAPGPARGPVVGVIAGLAVVATAAALVLRRRHGMRGLGPAGQD
jgi:methionine-rich copper-binding protein CopC